MGTAIQRFVNWRGQRQVRRWVLRGVGIPTALLLALYLGLAGYAAHRLTMPTRAFSPERNPGVFGAPYRDVRFSAREDNVTIAGWYLPQPRPNRAIVIVHGKDGSRSSGTGERFQKVEIAAALHRRGFAVLLIDLRGHGESDDGRLSFGITERRDIQGAVEWLQNEGFEPGSIGLLGISLGGAASIGAAAEEAAIGAVVSDASYADVYPLIAGEWREASGLPDGVLPATLLMGQLLFGVDVADARPADEISAIAPRPVLIIHGSADERTPVAHAYALQKAAPHAELWVVPEALHGRSYDADPKAYINRLSAFFEKSLQQSIDLSKS